MKNILFVSYGGGHVSNLLPIYKEICHSPSVNPTFLALTTAQNYLDQRHVKYIGYKDLPFDLPIDNQKDAKILLDQIQNQPINPEESVAYLGWNMWDLEKQYGRKAAIEKYNKFGRACFYPINLMKKVLEAYSADLVVTTSAPRSEKAVIDAAVEMRIPSVCIPDIVVNLDLCGWIANNGFASKLCVATRKIKERIVALNRNPNSIVVTGSPAIESFAHPLASEEKSAFLKKLNIDTNKHIILYAPSPEYSKNTFTGKISNENLPKEILETICSYFVKEDKYQIIYRPHPNQNFNLESSFINNIIVDEGYDLKSIISISDVVITTASTVGILAQILGKPLLAVSLSVHFKNVDYSDFGDYVCVDSLDFLNAAIIKLLRKRQKIRPFNTAPIVFQEVTKNIKKEIERLLDF